MAQAELAAPNLTEQQLIEMLALVKKSDSVELKLTIPESQQRSSIAALRMDPLEAEIRQVFFLDTPELALDEAGVVARVRRTQRKGDDSVVKLRPVEPDQMPDELRQSPSFNIEVDAMPGGFVCSGSYKGLPKEPIRDNLLAGGKLRKLFSKEQRAFFREHAPEGIELDDLTVLGPIFTLKLRLRPETFGRKLVAELWLYPDGARILELSTKCLTSEAFQVAAESRAFLAERGIDLTGEQQTKTRTALEFFSKELSS